MACIASDDGGWLVAALYSMIMNSRIANLVMQFELNGTQHCCFFLATHSLAWHTLLCQPSRGGAVCCSVLLKSIRRKIGHFALSHYSGLSGSWNHGGPHFANFRIIWRYLSWTQIGTLELCPVWGIYGERRNLSEENRLRLFLVIVKFHKMSQMSHQMSHICDISSEENGLWIMEYPG